jgi:hypothetical protein
MAVIDIRCVSCDALAEVVRPASEWPNTPPCPACGAATEQIHLPKGYSFQSDPVVVYRSPDGSFRVPGDVNGPGAAKYEKLGYTRIEARTFAEVRRLEADMNRYDTAHAAPLLDRLQARREGQERERRSELFHKMASFSPQMRDLARHVIEKNNRKPKRSGSGSNVVIEVYS